MQMNSLKALLVFLLFIGIFPMIALGQYDTIMVAPSLEMKLKTEAWHKIQSFGRTSYEPSPVSYEYTKNKAVKIVVICDAILVSTDSARKELKAHCMDKKTESDSVKVVELKGFTVISYPDFPTVKKNRKTYCEITGIHPEGYIATITFEAPESDKSLMDSLVLDFVSTAHMISPNYLDEKYGYPIKDINKESLVEKRTYKMIAKIREVNPSFTPTETGYDELNNEARKQVDRDIQWGYSYQKYYKTRKKVTQGKMPYNDWLNSHFLQQDNEDVSFLKAYGAGNHGELFDGFNIALAKHFGDTLVFSFVGDALEINSKGKTIFWSYTFPMYPVKDNKSLMIFCFVYDTTYKKWDSYKTVFPKFVSKTEDIPEVKILKHTIGEQEYDNITTDYIVFLSDSGTYFIGNNQLYNTNFIKIGNIFTGNENYKAIIKGVSFENNKLGYSEISSNEIEGDVVGLKYIPADKRCYQSTLQFEDLKGDGVNEAYLISVSNRKLIQVKVFTTTEKGLKEVLIDEGWKTLIKETDFFKKLSKESTQSSSSFQR